MTAPARTDADRLAMRLLLLAELRRAITTEMDAAKQELAGLVSPGTTLRPQLDGRDAGRVAYSTGRVTAAVTDPVRFGLWVAENYPTEVQQLAPIVRPAYAARVLEVSKAAQRPVTPTGEVDPPGISVAIGRGSLTVTPDDSMAGELWAEVRNTIVAEITGGPP